jgi:hypothetical protein
VSKTVEYEQILRDVGGLANTLGVPAANLATEVAVIAMRLGCKVIGCDAEPADRAPLPDLAARYRDAADEIDLAAAGISKR